MTTFVFLIVFIVFVGLLWLRFAPIDKDNWHVDPAEPMGDQDLQLIGREAPRFPGAADEVLAQFDEIALSEPNTRRIEGDLAEGMMTFVSRTKFLGMAEVITVKAVSEGELTKVAIASRPRFSASNRRAAAERLDRWLQDMRLRLGQG